MIIFYTLATLTVVSTAYYDAHLRRNIRILQVIDESIVLHHKFPCEPAEIAKQTITLEASCLDETVALDRLYIATPYEFADLVRESTAEIGACPLRLLSPAQNAGCFQMLGFSAPLPHSDAKVWKSTIEYSPTLSVGVIAPFGPFGDSIVFITGLRILQKVLLDRYNEVHFTLYQEHLSADVEQLYVRANLSVSLVTLPRSFTVLQAHSMLIDFTAPDQNRVLPWVDNLLEIMDIDSATILPERKRNCIHISAAEISKARNVLSGPLCQPQQMLYLHSQASTPVRSMPSLFVEQLISTLMDTTSLHIITSDASLKQSSRLTVLGSLNLSFHELAAIIRVAGCVLTVDTAVYHVADALNIPGLVLFTTIPAVERMHYYPSLIGIDVLPQSSRLIGMHASNNEDDLAEVRDAWSSLSIKTLMEELHRVVKWSC